MFMLWSRILRVDRGMVVYMFLEILLFERIFGLLFMVDLMCVDVWVLGMVFFNFVNFS